MSAANLLPRSGIGVDGTNLIIAPPGNPVISLDARLLDRVDLIGRSPATAYITSGIAVGGTVATIASFLPGGPFLAAGLAYLAHERFSEARRRSSSRDLLLGLGSLEVALHVADGPAAAQRIADQLAPYSRSAPIPRPDVYEDAKRRLRAQISGRPELAHHDLKGSLVVGSDLVMVADGKLHVGKAVFKVEDVREYALRGANLPLPGGRLLQAAMGLLVVAAESRAKGGEDVDTLSARIAAYEKWTGRTAGR